MEQKFCMECGSPLNDGDAFCMECGTPTVQQPQETEETPKEQLSARERQALRLRELRNIIELRRAQRTDTAPSAQKEDSEARIAQDITVAQNTVISESKEDFDNQAAPPRYDCNAQEERAGVAARTDNWQYTRPLMYYMTTNKRLSRALLAVYLSLLTTITIIMITSCFYPDLFDTGVNFHWLVLICAVVTALLFVLVYAIPVNYVSAEQLKYAVMGIEELDILRPPTKRLIFPWALIVIFSISSLVWHYCDYGVFMRGVAFAWGYCLAVSLLYMIGSFTVAKRNAAMANYLWGWESPAHDTPFVIDYDEEREINDYQKFLRTPPAARCVDESEYTERCIRNRRMSIAAMIALFISCVAVFVPVSAALTNKFSSVYANYSAMSSAKTLESIERLYGEINFMQYTKNGCVVEYYDDDYLDIYEDIYDLSRRTLNAPPSELTSINAEINQLEAEMANLKYKYLAIYLEVHSYDSVPEYNYLESKDTYDFSGIYIDRIDRIELDTARDGLNPQIKQLEKTEIDCPSVRKGTALADCSAEIEAWFDDGSYLWLSVPLDQTPIDATQTGVQQITINDKWCMFTFNVRIV